MDPNLISDLSAQLKDIARDLSFLGQPRFPLRELSMLFPQHQKFIYELDDTSTPFKVDLFEKRRQIDLTLKHLSQANLDSHLKSIFSTRIDDYLHLIAMIENFGTPLFYEHCTKLYGSSHHLARNVSFYYFLEQIPQFCLKDEKEKKYNGEGSLIYLQEKMTQSFPAEDFEVKASTSLLSDSSAGRRVLKLNIQKDYSENDLNIYLVHEGWVHLGTSLNGKHQEHQPWLATWAPRTTFLQEGLAILTELITGHMTHKRWNKIFLRHMATSMAERGSNISDVYAYLKHQDMEELDAFKLTLRIFRGVPLDGGMAFTKELLYLHGLIELLHQLHSSQADLSTLWYGKMSFREHRLLIENDQQLQPQLKHFPAELKSSQVKERLKKLTELSFSLFNHGFLQD